MPVEEAPAPLHAAAAVDAILAAYVQLAGVDVRGAVPLQVHWAVAMPAGLLGETWHDQVLGCDTWLVADAMFRYPKVLPHELGHCARWVLTGDGDAGHADLTWWGDGGLVDQAFAAERAAGY